MTFLQVSVLLLFANINGPGVDSVLTPMRENVTDLSSCTRLGANMERKFETVLWRINDLTALSKIQNTKQNERMGRIELEQKERLQSVLDRVDQLDNLMKESRNESQSVLHRVEQLENLMKESRKESQSVLHRVEQLDNLMKESRKESQCDTARQFSDKSYVADGAKLQSCSENPYLDQLDTDHLKWIVFQRRARGRTSFYRRWKDYKHGFGSDDGDFWLGLEPLHKITSQGVFELRVEMIWKGTKYYAQYSTFRITGESDGYRLKLGNYVKGTAGDSMAPHRDLKFSTVDRDNDLWSKNCAEWYQAGWWFNKCGSANLNGRWGFKSNVYGVRWEKVSGNKGSLSFAEMKIRQVN